jgi:uncharacterized protein YjbJ (UPF0337 family)
MNKDEMGGKVDNLKGRAKEAAGALTGNKQREAEGQVQRAGGAVREKFGQVKEAVKDSTKRSPDDDIEDED